MTIALTPYDALPAPLLDELPTAGSTRARCTTLVVGGARRGRADRSDVTSVATMPPTRAASADFAAREAGVVAGLGVAELVFGYVLGDEVEVEPTGSPTAPRSGRATPCCAVAGPVRGLLTAERTALNFACHLSGVATATAAWVEALEGTRARVLDTRKTLPGCRALQKYAVRCGGGVNHRFSLSDRAMVKDNHVRRGRRRGAGVSRRCGRPTPTCASRSR